MTEPFIQGPVFQPMGELVQQFPGVDPGMDGGYHLNQFFIINKIEHFFERLHSNLFNEYAYICHQTKNMKKESRRKFIGNLGKASLAGGVMVKPAASAKPSRELKKRFIHHVYFWLKNPGNAADKAKLIEGLRKLSTVKTIQQFSIGQPADTRREVIESSYALSWFTFFKNGKDQASYQVDPIHLKFVEDYSHLWAKVIVYDTVDV